MERRGMVIEMKLLISVKPGMKKIFGDYSKFNQIIAFCSLEMLYPC